MNDVEPNARELVSVDALMSASEVERARARNQLNADVEAFLRMGGQITQIENSVRADPPRKPDAQYGVSPI